MPFFWLLRLSETGQRLCFYYYMQTHKFTDRLKTSLWGNKSKISSSQLAYRWNQNCTLNVRFVLFNIRFQSPMSVFQPSMFTFLYFWFLLFGLSGIVISIFPASSKGLIYFSEKFFLPASPINSCISFRLRGTTQNWRRSCNVTCSFPAHPYLTSECFML